MQCVIKSLQFEHDVDGSCKRASKLQPREIASSSAPLWDSVSCSALHVMFTDVSNFKTYKGF